jgi:hypothetical protein
MQAYTILGRMTGSSQERKLTSVRQPKLSWSYYFRRMRHRLIVSWLRQLSTTGRDTCKRESTEMRLAGFVCKGPSMTWMKDRHKSYLTPPQFTSHSLTTSYTTSVTAFKQWNHSFLRHPLTPPDVALADLESESQFGDWVDDRTALNTVLEGYPPGDDTTVRARFVPKRCRTTGA